MSPRASHGRYLQTCGSVTCVDPRCVPEAFFGPDIRAAVFRNAGGRATEDAVRTFNVLRALIDLKLVAIVHHTGTGTSTSPFRPSTSGAYSQVDCGMGHVTEDEVRAYAKSKNPAAAADVDKIDFGLWKEEHLQDTVREDVRKLRAEKSLEGMEVLGFVLDTQTGVVTELEI